MNRTLIINTSNTSTHPPTRKNFHDFRDDFREVINSPFFLFACQDSLDQSVPPHPLSKTMLCALYPTLCCKPLVLSHSSTEFAFDAFQISWSLLLKLTIILLLPLANCLYDTDIYTYSQWVTCKWETVYTHRHLTLSIILIMKKKTVKYIRYL